ncbi:rhodanese-like domain-containing protein [Brumimicrobium glaciale]|uniref:Rhodanese-like domain-containing protein n=2 Tax=Brumimicrobium glaciale TaxID=200475 RepID=A0A4V1WG23_9FLAO|nr:rhodanese-like domain-containing protein [Brumimicrobium glaciale]
MFGAVVFTSCSNSQTTESPKSEQKVEQKKEEKVDFENAFIVDVRTTQEFESGHFEGAINIPVDEVEDYLLEFEGHDQIVVYCRSGARSGRAKSILEAEGHQNVINAINLDHLNKLKANQK